MTTKTWAGALAFAMGIGAAFPCYGGEKSNASPGVSKSASFELGDDLFFHETFQGNGRTCSTCHDPRNEFTVSPELVQARYQQDPTHPLFRAIDSDDGRGNNYDTLLDHALFRVTIPLHPNVTLVDTPAQRAISDFLAITAAVGIDPNRQLSSKCDPESLASR